MSSDAQRFLNSTSRPNAPQLPGLLKPTTRVSAVVKHVTALEDAPAKLQKQLADLGLLGNVQELDEQGYTIVKGALDPKLALHVRDLIIQQTEKNGATSYAQGERPAGEIHLDVDTCTEEEFKGISYQANLLFADPAFEEVLMCEKPLALITYLLGESCLLFSMGSHVKGPGGVPLDLHSDNGNGMIEPFREVAEVANCNYVLTPYDAEGKNGSLFVWPGSHKLCRKPVRAEQLGQPECQGIPIEAEVGDCVVWHGNFWHGSCKREVPGLRVNLAAAYCRQYISPQEYRTNGSDMPEEMRERHKDDKRFLTLLGDKLGHGWKRDSKGPNYAKMAKAPQGLFD